MVSLARPVSTTTPPMALPGTPCGARHPRSPVSSQPGPALKAAAVAAASPAYPAITPGPRASTRPCVPSGTGSRVAGSTTRSSVPGTATPTLPRTFCTVRLQASTGDVSVMPHPLSTEMPAASKKSSRCAASDPPPLMMVPLTPTASRTLENTSFCASQCSGRVNAAISAAASSACSGRGCTAYCSDVPSTTRRARTCAMAAATRVVATARLTALAACSLATILACRESSTRGTATRWSGWKRGRSSRSLRTLVNTARPAHECT
mmetsp:Transcript_9600/g.23800  ORF Transcript_9600/g.23800 Transcript_9600/m.23800 type:complete len:264 (-) Transcript_9600:1212-2003(-)